MPNPTPRPNQPRYVGTENDRKKGTKRCTLCEETKDIEWFSTGTGRCKPCRVSAQQARYRAIHPEVRLPRYVADALTRMCNRCHAVLPATTEWFNAERRVRDGLQAACRTCMNASVDPVKSLANARRYYAAHKDACVARSVQWNRDHPEHNKIASQRRRARMLSVESTLTVAEWTEILSYFHNRCAYCLVSLLSPTMDHIRPVSKGGPHSMGNVVPACRTCNSSKGTKDILFSMLPASYWVTP